MAAYREFLRSFGGIMTAYIFIACALWMLGMIVLPQLLMVERSFVFADKSASAAVSQIEGRIDRLFVQKQRNEREMARLRQRIADLEAGKEVGGAAGGATLLSPFAPKAESEEPGDVPGLEAKLAGLVETNKRIVAEVAEADERLVALRVDAAPRYGFANYVELLANDLNRSIFLKTIWASVIVTFTALLICYPIAFYLAKVAPAQSAAILMLGLVVPYWINEILRTFAWLMILSDGGILNQTLQGLGLIDEPVRWREGNFAVVVGMTYAYILFMVFPMYNTIETLDKNQVEAARDLGAAWWRIHWRIIIPHAKPGIAVGCIITFMLAAGSYAVPLILGGTRSKWFTEIIYDAFYEANDWGVGSAYAFVLLLTCIVFILAMMRLFRVNLEEIAH